MLHSFPSPYPDELWYSVMCRYIARCGNIGFVQNKRKEVPFSLLYDKSIARIVQELPPGLVDIPDIVMNHTLFPYLTRLYTMERKQRYFDELISETASVIKWKAPTKTASSLRYCPSCIKEEQKRYGESYWHREHQLPLVTVCPKHKCKLSIYLNNGRRIHMPEDAEKEPVFETTPYGIELAVASYEYLTASWEVCPTAGHNNLFCALERGGYTSMKRFRLITVDPELLYRHLEKQFGEKLVMRYFGKRISGEELLRIKNWSVTEPERYIMLALMLGLNTEITFGKMLKDGDVKLRSA